MKECLHTCGGSTIRQASITTRDGSGQPRVVWAIKGKERVSECAMRNPAQVTQPRTNATVEPGRPYVMFIDTYDGSPLAHCGGRARFVVLPDGSAKEWTFGIWGGPGPRG